MTHRALIFGASGQVGQCLVRQVRESGVVVEAPGRDRVDLADPDAVRGAIRSSEASHVYNCAAFTAVDDAESRPEDAMAINAGAPEAMAEACREAGKVFIHLSTDYVFDGKAHAPYGEAAPTNPLNAYGRTKLAGEQAVAAIGGTFAILRTSWVFSGHGRNFVRTMLRLAREKGAVSVVDDQTGCPTYAGDIAAAMETVARKLASDYTRSGLYHYCGSPVVTWAGFAEAIFEAAGLDVPVTRVDSSHFAGAAERPAYSVLETHRIKQLFDIDTPDWRVALPSVIMACNQ